MAIYFGICGRGRDFDARALPNGGGEHEPIVVVGVVAHKIDPAGGGCAGQNFEAEEIAECGHRNTASSAAAADSGRISLEKTPARSSVPARYFILAGARRIGQISRRTVHSG